MRISMRHVTVIVLLFILVGAGLRAAEKPAPPDFSYYPQTEAFYSFVALGFAVCAGIREPRGIYYTVIEKGGSAKK